MSQETAPCEPDEPRVRVAGEKGCVETRAGARARWRAELNCLILEFVEIVVLSTGDCWFI
jgi:hypothetical protein